MAAINPTQLTPPRVALIDDRTGAISREWYRFFLSLLTATQNNQDETFLAPDTDSLLASYDAVFSEAIQGLESAPDCCSETASLDSKFNSITQGLALAPRPELGTMAPLQQADVPWFTFNTAPTPVPTAVGSVYWDGGTTLGVQATANVLIRVGEAEYVYAKASSAITKGQLCYHTGAVGASGVITVAPTPLALADPGQIVGVAAETIALNGFGLIQISGDLRGFNTTGSSVGETWADGDPLYYNPAYVGSFTKTKPSAPNQKTYIGEVTNAGSGASGSIHIRIVPGSVLGGTDSNVQFGTLANGDLIQYDSALQYWKNVPASSASIGTATNLAGGAANRIAYQTAPGTTNFITAPSVANTYLEWSGTAFQWSSNPLGTVTSVNASGGTTGLTFSGGPITTSGTLTLGGTLGVANGGTGQTSYTDGQLLIGNTTGNTLTKATLTAGTNISITNGAGSITINATDQYTGTVTSVAASGGTTGLTFTGSPITTSGTLTLGGTLGVANGGTGVTTLTSGYLVKGNGASAVSASVIYDNGTNVGIGTTSLTEKLTVSGNIALSGKVQPNVQSVASAATITPNANSDTQVSVTALAVPATIAAPSGTPSDGQSLVIRIKDNGTGRALTWTTGSSGAYRAVGITLPTTTTANKTVYIGCKYNSTDLRWDAIALSQEA